MNRLLRNVIIGPEGTGRAADISGWNIIGKTGTTNDDYDSWFIGMSPYAVAGIWTGYDNPKRIHETASAIKIWKNIMTKYLEGKPNIDYNYDKDVVSATYCKASGNLANSGCPSATGYYLSSNMPGSCTAHSGASSENSSFSNDNSDTDDNSTTEDSELNNFQNSEESQNRALQSRSE